VARILRLTPGPKAPTWRGEILAGELAPGARRKVRKPIARLLGGGERSPERREGVQQLGLGLPDGAPRRLRDVKAALPLAENAVRLEAANGRLPETLGVLITAPTAIARPSKPSGPTSRRKRQDARLRSLLPGHEHHRLAKAPALRTTSRGLARERLSTISVRRNQED